MTYRNYDSPGPEVVVVRAADRLANLSGPASVIQAWNTPH